MEDALYITSSELLKFYEDRFGRIYYGAEFCEFLLPELNELDKVLDFILAHKIKFSLVTPYTTDWGVKKIEKLLKFILAKCKDIEVVVNDLGLLNLLNKEYSKIEIVLGRLLMNQKRDPRFKMGIGNTSLENHYKSALDNEICREFFYNKGIRRMELCNTGKNTYSSINSQFRYSIYYPFVFLAASRFCMTSAVQGQLRNNRYILEYNVCRKKCRAKEFELSNNNFPVPLILKGNALFYKNESLPNGFESYFDRVVYQPQV